MSRSHFLSNVFGDMFNSVNGISEEPDTLTVEEKSEELEYVVFGILEDTSELDVASTQEHHEQLEYRFIDPRTNESSGTLRTRAYDGQRFELTIKSYHKDKPGCIENTVDVDIHMHNAVRMVATRRLEKIRYTYPFTVEHNGETIDLKWEIDRFIRPDGQFEPMVKIDLEIPYSGIPIPEVPFTLSDKLVSGNGHWVEKEKWVAVENMYERVTHKLNHN